MQKTKRMLIAYALILGALFIYFFYTGYKMHDNSLKKEIHSIYLKEQDRIEKEKYEYSPQNPKAFLAHP